MLMKPYRDGGPAINGWDIAGLKVGVDVAALINRPATATRAGPWSWRCPGRSFAKRRRITGRRRAAIGGV
jgi:hypothetical protein